MLQVVYRATTRFLRKQAGVEAEQANIGAVTLIQRLGSAAILDALHRSLAHADRIAAMALVVNAKDQAASAFDQRYGLVTLQAQPSRLFVPMRLVAQLLG